MAYPDMADIPIAGHLISPRAEGEIAFRLKKDLVGPGVTEADVLATIEAGDLKAKKIGSTYRITRANLEAFINS